MNDALQAPPRSSAISAAALEKGGQDFTRWAIVAVLAGVVLIPPLAAPSLVNFGRSVVRVELMLAEIVVVLGWCLTQREVFLPRRVNRTAGALVGAWTLASLAATVLAVHVAPAVLRTTEWAVHGLFGLVLWSEMQRDRRVLEAVVRAIPVGFALFVVAVGLEALQMPDPVRHNWMADVPYLGHIRRFGIYALACVAFSARALLDPDSSTRSRRWAWAGLTLGWAVLIWSGGRGAVGAGLLVGGCLWALAGSRRTSFALAFVATVVAGTLVSLCFPVENGGGGLWRLLNIGTAGSASEFTSGRTELWLTSLAAWRQRPWLGLGPDASGFVLNPFGHEQPHNVVLQALVDWGLIGAAAFLILLLGLMLTAVRRTVAERDGALSSSRAVAAAYLVGATALALLDGVFYDARPLIIVTAAAAITLLPIGAGGGRPVPVTRGLCQGLCGMVLGIAALGIAHLGTVLAVWSPGVPAPDSLRVAYLKAFPSTGFLIEPATWVRAWADEDPEAARSMAQWGGRHAIRPWNYLRLEADLLLERGLREEALALHARANRLEAEAYRYWPHDGASD